MLPKEIFMEMLERFEGLIYVKRNLLLFFLNVFMDTERSVLIELAVLV
jgi:hypothetical protein